MFFCVNKVLRKAENGYLDLTRTKLKPHKVKELVDALNQRHDIHSIALHQDTITPDNGHHLVDLSYVNRLDIAWHRLKEQHILIIREKLENNALKAGHVCPSVAAKDKVFAMFRAQEAGFAS